MDRTDQCVFYVEDEQIAVGDNMIVSRAIACQQTPGAVLAASGVSADESAMYLTKANEVMIWPYDDRCRLIGEDVWEYEPSARELIKLDPEDVLTAHQGGELLAPLIKPLPSFDGAVTRPHNKHIAQPNRLGDQPPRDTVSRIGTRTSNAQSAASSANGSLDPILERPQRTVGFVVVLIGLRICTDGPADGRSDNRVGSMGDGSRPGLEENHPE